MRPVRVALGGLVFAVAMAPDGWIPMVICAAAGLAIAFLAEHAAHSMRPGTQTGARVETAPFVLLSLYADLAVLIGTLLFVLVPVIGALFACLMFLFVYRLRQRRRRKHKGLRILKG
jgi:Flp pilus assembly protein TadB